MFKRGGVKNVIDAIHCRLNALEVAHVADMELNFIILIVAAHVVLFIFVAGKNFNRSNIGVEKAFQSHITERPRAARNHQCLALENAHDNHRQAIISAGNKLATLIFLSGKSRLTPIAKIKTLPTPDRFAKAISVISGSIKPANKVIAP